MSLKLKTRERPLTGSTRIICERLRKAAAQVERFRTDADAAVHDARKRLKETRAVLRLLRSALPAAVYQFEKSVYRDTARPLSELRDTRIRLDALEQVTADADVAPDDVTSLRQELEARRITLEQTLTEESLKPLRATLVSAIERPARWPIEQQRGWKTIAAALRKTYRRARRGMRIARAEPGDENLHEWRKRSKTLWHQLQVFEGSWPGLLAPLGDEVHHLSDLLGEDHDLAVLAGLIRANGASGLDAGVRDRLLEHIASKRTTLQQSALDLGSRLYAEKPGDFARRMSRYWRAWRADECEKVGK